MSNAKDPFSILNKDRGDLRITQVQKKQEIKLYRKGQAPENINQSQDDDDDDDDIFPEAKSFSSLTSEKIQNRLQQIDTMTEEQTEDEKTENVRRAAIQRRRQVQQTQIIEESDQKQPQNLEFKKPMEKIQQTQVQKQAENTELNTSSRAQIRARLLQKQIEEAQNSGKETSNQQKQDQKNVSSSSSEEEEVEEEEESEEESDDDDEEEEDDQEKRQMMKPVYIPKTERQTQNQVLEEELALQKEKEKIQEMKKNETKALILDAIRKDQQNDDDNNDNNSLIGVELPNDNDNLNPSFEYEQWKIRELKRIRKTRDEQEKRKQEEEDKLRRRNMTNEQIIEEDKKLGLHQKKEQRQYTFMQKYYHKGAFYQDDEDEVYKRDFNMPVGEELMDKSALPIILQKRRGDYGKKGQSKYTHLTDQDTTNFDPKYKVDQGLQQKAFSKYAALKQANLVDPKQNKKKQQ